MSKYRVKGGGTPEVHSARSKLDGVLQTLVEKKEDSPTTDEEGKAQEFIERIEPLSTPTKRSGPGRPNKKRKRGKEDPLQDMGQYHHTYVMKLFDRSVDLAQFEEDSPLYPICRAWMRNQPHNRSLAPRDPSPSPEHPLVGDDEDDEFGDVYQLMPPLPLPKSEPGEGFCDPRIPAPLHYTDRLDIYAPPELAPPCEQLLINHLARWKETRKRWKIAAQENERRYSDSLKVLGDMFDHQCKDQ